MDKLKLMALDSQDLDVLAAHMQDAVLKPTDMRFDPRARQFVIKANRFVWENARGRRSRGFERRLSALHFDRVLSVKTRGVNRKSGGAVLSLLTIQFFPDQIEGFVGGDIELIFAGDASVMLTVECIEAQLADLGPVWETRNRPRHPERS